ncbi:trehalase-like [Schistocerca piceifrons]|uniref:trehalase-like n=1 Tax=Schistocerca piceifrons TaxID=274613 RepID=UPI001F5E9E67|nr:trehalase-like [Schistocerca piceifrons]
MASALLVLLAAAAFAAAAPAAHEPRGQKTASWEQRLLDPEDDPDALPPACDSQVYCQGELLHTVQMAQLFDDSKTFVDMKQRQAPAQTLANFEAFMAAQDGQPGRTALARFVADNFEEGGQLLNWTLPDWHANPALLSRIKDARLRDWAAYLNAEWPQLARRVPDDVRLQPDRYSLIYVPNGFVVPGGRFQEYYYWDTYWIVQGLLATDMPETVRGVVGNLVYLVQQLGHVPNGGRVYYKERAQPPLLAPMVEALVRYCERAGCEQRTFLAGGIAALDAEFQFWMHNRTVSVGGRQLARYFSPSRGPRPESYSEDYIIAHGLSNDSKVQQRLYTDLKSAAESGWDFSSRWFITNGTNEGNLSNTHTRYIIPVDLNAFLCMNARILSEFHTSLGNTEKAGYYTAKMNEILEAIDAVLWNDEEGIWLDYDMLNKVSRNQFYPSNLAPLWTGCHKKSKKEIRGIVSYLKDNDIENYLGGAPASLILTGEQWDFPNVWPPLENILIMGLQKTGVREATEFAFELAQIWIHATYTGYIRYNNMFEKYDAEKPGEFGNGGEYVVQPGFGWTNGGILELLNEYGQNLTIPDLPQYQSNRTTSDGASTSTVHTAAAASTAAAGAAAATSSGSRALTILSYSRTVLASWKIRFEAAQHINFILIFVIFVFANDLIK